MMLFDFRGLPLQVDDPVVVIRRSYNARSRLIQGKVVKFSAKRIHVSCRPPGYAHDDVLLLESHSVMKLPT